MYFFARNVAKYVNQKANEALLEEELPLHRNSFAITKLRGVTTKLKYNKPLINLDRSAFTVKLNLGLVVLTSV